MGFKYLIQLGSLWSVATTYCSCTSDIYHLEISICPTLKSRIAFNALVLC